MECGDLLNISVAALADCVCCHVDTYIHRTGRDEQAVTQSANDKRANPEQKRTFSLITKVIIYPMITGAMKGSPAAGPVRILGKLSSDDDDEEVGSGLM